MATFEELEDAFTAINRKAPSAAHSLILQELAVRSQNGVITDEQAFDYGITQAKGTTSVAALTYQFFTGKTPTAAGFDYLVNSSTNTNDLNDPSYQNFNPENRYINFAVNLGVAGEGRAIFSQIYNPLSFAETVAVAYNRIIGTSQAEEAGIDVNAAIANIAGRKAYFDAVVNQAGISAADHDLAVKAAVVGYIMAEAVKAGVGAYVQGLDGFYADLADDGKANFNVDLNSYIVATSPPGNTVELEDDTSYDVGAVGAEDVFSNNADKATGSIVATKAADISIDTGNGFDVIGTKTALVAVTGFAGADIDIAMGGGNDTAWLNLTEVANSNVTIDGGVGADALSLVLQTNLATTEVEGFETVTLFDNGNDWDVDFGQFSDVKTLNVNASDGQALQIDNLTDDVVVSIGGEGVAILNYDDVDAAAITLAASGEGVGVNGVEDTLTVTATKSLTVEGIESSSAELILKGNFSVNLGDVALDGDERKVDLTAVTTKDVALTYFTGAEDSDTILLGGGDDALLLRVISKGDAIVTLGGGEDTITFDGGGAGTSNVAGFNTNGSLKAVMRVTDFSEDDTVIVGRDGSGTAGIYEALAAGAFTGVAETDSAYFDIAKTAVNNAVFVPYTYTVFDAADGSGVFVYGAGGTNADTDDFYIKLVGVSMDDLNIDDNVITHG
ncbi:hypothetical protein [Caulobacter sp. NIBR2454]|uniref:hypothetical protein n=1 Tax=Caulobacter sp. NIBR2454 TaxID=3015996 RepID=UPI0022B6CC96|nr:hypothetical protein [Caulobacter sp. NIBR2454]